MNVQNKSSLKDFQLLQELGKGAFSVVYKVRRIADSQEYALKKVKMNSLKQRERENALNEIRLLASINDKYIVAYKDSFLDEDNLCIVMELLPGGDVQRRINQALKGGPPFTEQDIWKALIHLVRGLKYLHDIKIVHRDLKSANIFVAQDGTYKLGDLNVSKVAKQGFVYTQTGTPNYASPEVWRDEPYDMKSDIWSLGCVIYEMANLKTPFRANKMDELYKKVQRGQYDQLSSKYSKDLSEIISLLLQVKPALRPSCDQLLKHPLLIKYSDSHHQSESLEKRAPLLQTIQIPRNGNQLKLPKSNYDNDKTNRSAERLNDKSTENSPSPFRSPQPATKLLSQSRVTQSQVIQRPQSELIRNQSNVERGGKHQLLLYQPKDVVSNKQERPSSSRPQLQIQQQEKRVSPHQREQQKSHSPQVKQSISTNRITSSLPAQAVQGSQIKRDNPIGQNIRYTNNVPIKPSQVFDSQPTPKYQKPQSAVVRQPYVQDRVFPAQAKVTTKHRTQPQDVKKEPIVSRQVPAGKPSSRPLSSNLYNERIYAPPTYNLITNNYNHYYPIDQYQQRNIYAADYRRQGQRKY
ncbi:G2-specific serine/threonine protein kinase [Paramecium bursaria]